MNEKTERLLDKLADALFCIENELPFGSLLKPLSDPIWSDGKHCGDCTKEPHTCCRCLYEEYLETAKPILQACKEAGLRFVGNIDLTKLPYIESQIEEISL